VRHVLELWVCIGDAGVHLDIYTCLSMFSYNVMPGGHM
jgi:hypothetical protein